MEVTNEYIDQPTVSVIWCRQIIADTLDQQTINSYIVRQVSAVAK